MPNWLYSIERTSKESKLVAFSKKEVAKLNTIKLKLNASLLYASKLNDLLYLKPTECL
jgi:hypothetical protein